MCLPNFLFWYNFLKGNFKPQSILLVAQIIFYSMKLFDIYSKVDSAHNKVIHERD